jgi:cytochrome c-type biogenesis protein CcmE
VGKPLPGAAAREPEGSPMNRSYRFVLLLFVVVASVAYLVLTSVKNTGMRYLTVTELAQMGRSPSAEGFRLDGTVVPGSVQYDQREQRLNFHMTDGKEQVAVEYLGLKPDAFADGREVVVEGTYQTTSHVLEASKLVTKCPSKYEAKGLGKDRS